MGCQNFKTELLGAPEILVVIKYDYSVAALNSSLSIQVVSHKFLLPSCGALSVSK